MFEGGGMTDIEKAISNINYGLQYEGHGEMVVITKTSARLAISALEKQIPKKPEWTPAYQSCFSAGDEAETLCPGCGELIEDDQPICLDCYQVIDWSVEE